MILLIDICKKKCNLKSHIHFQNKTKNSSFFITINNHNNLYDEHF